MLIEPICGHSWTPFGYNFFLKIKIAHGKFRVHLVHGYLIMAVDSPLQH